MPPLFIILLRPGLRRGLAPARASAIPSSPAKFAIGLFFVAAGLRDPDRSRRSGADGRQGEPALAGGHLLLVHTIGELCLSPVGLSAMSKLAPARIAGLMMGVWFLALSVGNYLGGRGGERLRDVPAAAAVRPSACYALVAAVVLALADQADPTDAGALTA